jgi:hypothetical protein
LLNSLWRDLRYAARTLTRSPGFTIIAVLVMGLGIGANITLFTVVRSVLLNPLPFRDPGQLYAIYESETKTTNLNKYFPVDAGSVAEWQRSTQKIAQLALVSPWQSYNVPAEGGKLPEKIDAEWRAWNFFPILGVTPALRRSFTSGDDRSDAEDTVIQSSSFWKRRV